MKFLFYYCGKAVYEGDETHKHLERIRTEFKGDFKAAVLKDADTINKILNQNEKEKRKTRRTERRSRP